MSNDRIKERLNRASASLKEDLEKQLLPQLRIKRKQKSWATDTDGRHCEIATWGRNRPTIELWLDKATGGNVHRFWFGFAAPERSKSKLAELIKKLPKRLGPSGRRVTDSDWITDNRGFYFLSESVERKLTRPFWEDYQNKRWYNLFGMYDWGGHSARDPLYFDTWCAATFIGNVVRSIEEQERGDSDDEELIGFKEGKKRKLFITHRHREAKMRKQKILQTLRRNGKLMCEVPRCGFDFFEKYGALGKDYAHVHHKKPLGSGPAKGVEVTLDDLAVVCANCHAMIHRKGGCRPIESLIPKPQKIGLASWSGKRKAVAA
jgi:hypothetical protein